MLHMKRDIPTGAYSWVNHVVSRTLVVRYVIVNTTRLK
jgi:hypothetical protein